jgi:hypothetical protein
MQSSTQTQSFDDPKIILTASLLRQRDSIVNQINSGAFASALKAMATLICQVDFDNSQAQLIKARKELVENTIFNLIPSTKTLYYFQLINDYLNPTYFADYHKAKPKFQTEGKI